MELIPSIDILDGQVVQLTRGDRQNPQVYDLSIPGAARRWASAGARRLHIVDLDSARSGSRENEPSVISILEQQNLSVQISGVRSYSAAEKWIEAGARWVVFGAVAITTPSVVLEAIQSLGTNRVIVRVDETHGRVATDGRAETSNTVGGDQIQDMKQLGVENFMYTDVDRDGTLSGPNVEFLGELNRIADHNLIAAGGIGDASHLRSLADIGITAVVLGTSIYSGRIDFQAEAALYHTEGT